MRLKVTVINLAREVARRERVLARLSVLGINAELEDAFDRKQISEADLRRAFGSGRWGGTHLPATPGDMACSLTHQRLWRRIAAQTEPALILEDDAWPADSLVDWVSARAASVMAQHDLDILRLEYWPDNPPERRVLLGRKLSRERDATVYHLRGPALGTCAYCITPAAAQKLLQRFEKLEVPVDHFLFGERAAMGWRVLKIGFVDPAPVWHDVYVVNSDLRDERAELGIHAHTLTRSARFSRMRMGWRHQFLTLTGQAQRVEIAFDGPRPPNRWES